MQSPIAIPWTPGWVAEFRAFIMHGNVVELAVGIIIGVAFSNFFIPPNGQHYESWNAAQKAPAPTINIGLFSNTIINSLIISFAIFWVVKAMSRMVRKEAPPEPGPTKTEALLTEIRTLLVSVRQQRL